MLNGGYLWFTGEVKNQFIVYIGAVSAAIFSTAILLALHFKRRCPLVISLSKPSDKKNVTEYLISILTSAWLKSQCGLSTIVSVKIQGVYDDTGFILLKNQKARREIFKRGSNDIFHITTDKTLGDLVSITVRLLNKFDDIYCKWVPVKIELMRFDTREKWCTTEIPDLTCTKEVTKTIPVAKPMLETLRFRNYTRNILKFHSWISLLMFPESYGGFTIADRIILLIFTETSFLFGCMVAFFLFHQECTYFQLLVGDLIALLLTLAITGSVIISLEILMRNVRPCFKKRYRGLPKRPVMANKNEQLSSMDEYLKGLKNEDGTDANDKDKKLSKPKQKSGNKWTRNDKGGKRSKYSTRKRNQEKMEGGKQRNTIKRPKIDNVEFRRREANRTSNEIKSISKKQSIYRQTNNCNCNVTDESKVNPPTYNIKSACFEENTTDGYKTHIQIYKNDNHSWKTGNGDSLTDQPHVINIDVIETDFLPLPNTRQCKTRSTSYYDEQRMWRYDMDSDFLLSSTDYCSEETTLISKPSKNLITNSSFDKKYSYLNYNCSSKPRRYTRDSMHVSNQDDKLSGRQNVRNPEKSTNSFNTGSQKESYQEIKRKNRRTGTEQYDDQNNTPFATQQRRSAPLVSQGKQRYVQIETMSSQPTLKASMTQHISKKTIKTETKAYFGPTKNLNTDSVDCKYQKRSKHTDKGLVKDTSMKTVNVINDWTHDSGSSYSALINNDVSNAKQVLNNKETKYSPVSMDNEYSEVALVDVYLTLNLDERDELKNDSPVLKYDCQISSAKSQSNAVPKKCEEEYPKRYSFQSDVSTDRMPCRPLQTDATSKSTRTLPKSKTCRTPKKTSKQTSLDNFVSDNSFKREPRCSYRNAVRDNSLAENQLSTTSYGESYRQTSLDTLMSLSHETLSPLSIPSAASCLLEDDPYIARAMHLIDTTCSEESICYVPDCETNCDHKWILNTKPMQIDLFIRRFIKMLSVDLNTSFLDTGQSIIETATKWGETLCSRLWYRVELWMDELPLINRESVVHFPLDLSDFPEKESCSLLESWKRRIPLILKNTIFEDWDDTDLLNGTFSKPFLFDSKYSTVCKCKGNRCQTLRPVYKALLHISTYILSKVVKILQQKHASAVLKMRAYFKAYQVLTKEYEDRSLELAEAIFNHEDPDDILERSKIYSDCGLSLFSSLLVLRSINKCYFKHDYEHRLHATAHQLTFEAIYESELIVSREVIEDVHVRHLYNVAEKNAIDEVMNELTDPIFIFTCHLLKKRTLSSLLELSKYCSNSKVVEGAIKLRALAWKNEGFVIETDKTIRLVQALVRRSVKAKDNRLKVITSISKLRDLEREVHALVDGAMTCVVNWIVSLVHEQVRKKKAPKPFILSEVISLYIDIGCTEIHKYLFVYSCGCIDKFKETSFEDVKYRRKEQISEHVKGIIRKPTISRISYLKEHSDDSLRSKSKEIVRDVILESRFSMTKLPDSDQCCLKLEEIRELKSDIKPLMMYSKFLDMSIKKTDKEDIQKKLKKYEKDHKRYVSVNLQNVTDSYYVADIVPSYQRKDLFLLEWLVTGQLNKPLSPTVRRTFIIFMVLFIVCGLGYVTVKGGELTATQCQEWLCLYIFCTFMHAFILSPVKSILFTYFFEKKRTERQKDMYFDYL